MQNGKRKALVARLDGTEARPVRGVAVTTASCTHAPVVVLHFGLRLRYSLRFDFVMAGGPDAFTGPH